MELDLEVLEERLKEAAEENAEGGPKWIIAQLLLCDLNEIPPPDDLLEAAHEYLGVAP